MSISTPACKTSLRRWVRQRDEETGQNDRVDQGRSVSTAVSVGVKVAYFVRSGLLVTETERNKNQRRHGVGERKKSKGKRRGSEGSTGE